MTATERSFEREAGEPVVVPHGRALRLLSFAKDRLAQPLARTSAAALVVYVAGAAISYLVQVAAARIVGPDNYGIYAYVLAFTTLLAYFSTLGFNVSLQRFVPAYRAKAEWSLASGVIRYSHWAVAATGLGIFLVGICLTVASDKMMQSDLAATTILGLAAVPLMALNLVGAAVVRSFGGVVSSLMPERVVRDSVMLMVLVVAAWSHLVHPDATLVMGATLISSVATLALLRVSMRRLRPQQLAGVTLAYERGAWHRPMVPLAVITVADNLMMRAAVIVLGATGNLREAGIFAAALSLAMLTSLPRMAVGTVFTPNVSRLFARGEHVALQSLLAKSACLSLIGTIGVAVPLLLLAKPFLSWFGPEFVSGAQITAVLIVGQIASAASGPQQHIITMTGHEKVGAKLQMSCAVLNLVLGFLLVGAFGMFGVAIAMTASLIVWNVAMALFIHRNLGIQPGLVASAKVLSGILRGPSVEKEAA